MRIAHPAGPANGPKVCSLCSDPFCSAGYRSSKSSTEHEGLAVRGVGGIGSCGPVVESSFTAWCIPQHALPVGDDRRMDRHKEPNSRDGEMICPLYLQLSSCNCCYLHWSRSVHSFASLYGFTLPALRLRIS